jgi:hypothetical protein
MAGSTSAGTRRGLALRLPLVVLACLLLSGPFARRLPAQQEADLTLPENHSVQVLELRHDNVVTLYASLTNCTEVTVTLTLELTNVSATHDSPVTVDARGRKKFELVTLQQLDPALPWGYRSRFTWQPGRRNPRRVAPFVYSLPYLSQRHRVVQGYRGDRTHQAGSRNEYAIDWEMSEGTPVCAARAGVVVALWQDSDVGGPEPRYDGCSNYVILRHDDGTFAEYQHLQKDGVLVTLGQKVTAGETIARSGNTGHSSGPHLHFAVFNTLDGSTRKTIPVEFRTKEGVVTTLEEGESY